MNSDTYRRIPLLVAGLLAFLALSCSSALAAGKPQVNSFESTAKVGTLNSKEVAGAINPNGASTTYKIEYGPTEAYGSSTAEVSIGSGTKSVPISTELKGLLPDTTYKMRIVAKNSYGTVTSLGQWVFPENGPGRWLVGSGGAATYGSLGSFVINLPSVGAEIICSSTGSGTLGSKGGVGDHYSISFSGCGVYFSGKKTCTASIGTFNLNERLVASVESFTVNIPESCPYFGGSIKLPILDPFTATRTGSGAVLELPVLLESRTSFGTSTGTIKDSSTWRLTGEKMGATLNMEYGW
ncbi:MAG TPA: fibronectin type III domain-containing protein [Solirubrobacterales bacterium]|nr:fibronectin type III domain-containing protein [Solirubrobacterales bacterium]